MTVAAWTIGGILIVAAGLWPLRTVLRRPSGTDLDEARSLLSRLDTDLALAAPQLPSSTRQDAERYQLLAGAALAGTPDRADCRRSIDYARKALALLNESSIG
ncbi:MAG: hypothetical protein ABWZ98_01730 [Nakamurella sp.]